MDKINKAIKGLVCCVNLLCNECPYELYKYDYIWALIMHAFSWAFMITLPLTFVTAVGPLFYVVFAANVAIHAYVDHMKANQFKINLWQDQLVHMVQIVLTFIIL